jgi:ribonucleoside-triphosphate reductase
MEKNKDLVLEDGKVVPEKERTKCEIFSRPVGYMRPIQHWNKGKQQEFIERKTFKVDDGKEIQTSDR